MVRVHYLPPGHSGTEDVLKKALSGTGAGPRDFSGILYLGSGSRFIKESQKVFHALAGGTYIPPVMLTPRQLAKKLFQSHSGRLAAPSFLRVPLLMRLSGKGIGYAGLLSDFIAEVKARFPGLNADEIERETASLSEGLGIPAEVKERISDALRLMAAYDEALSNAGFADEEDSVSASAQYLDGLPFHTLIIDGLWRLTASEERLLSALMERSPRTTVLVPVDERRPEPVSQFLNFLDGFTPEVFTHDIEGPSKQFCYSACSGREDEMEAAARRIKADYISGRFRDLSRVHIVFPSASSYFGMAERVLGKYGIPYSFPSGAGPRMARASKELSSLLECALDDYPARGLSYLLTSALFEGIPEELRRWAPRLTLSGAHKGLSAFLALEGAPEAELKKLDRTLARLKKGFVEGAGYHAASKKYLEALRALGFAAGFADELEGRLKALPFLEGKGTGKITGREFSEVLNFLLSTIPPEEKGAGVQVMSFGEADGIRPGVLYFCGLKDGDIPSRPEMDLFLPERLRLELGLKTMRAHLLVEEFRFRRLLHSAGTVYLSYPEMEGDKLFLGSAFISGWERSDEKIYGIFSKEEELARKGKAPYSNQLGQIRVKCPYGKAHKYRVTDIDGFRSCPRKFFIERLMRIEPLEAKKYEIEPRSAGTIIHKVMERLVPHLAEPVEILKLKAGEVFDEAAAKEPVEAYWKELLRESFLSSIPRISRMEEEIRKEGFSPVRAELDIDGVLEGIPIKGKIDRLDGIEGVNFQILDYKTGMIDLAPKEILEKGANLQLFLYAALYGGGGGKVSRVGIYSLREMKTKFIPGKRDRKAGRDIDEFIDRAKGFLKETAGAIRAGDFSAIPISGQTCRQCHEKPYCPYIHGEAD